MENDGKKNYVKRNIDISEHLDENKKKTENPVLYQREYQRKYREETREERREYQRLYMREYQKKRRLEKKAAEEAARLAKEKNNKGT